MKPKQYKEFLKKVLIELPQRAIYCTGKVGIGKSEITKQIAKELNFEFKDVRLSLLDPTDLRGLPTIENNTTKWTKPEFLPDTDDKTNRILFFDEFSNAPGSVQNACLQLTLDRELGDYKLPDNTRIVCAGNGLDDGAYVFRMSSALSNRFVNIDFELSFDDWKEWAYENKINPMVLAFHNYLRGEKLHNFKTDTDDKAFASPRTWTFVSQLMGLNLEKNTFMDAVCGTVGNGAGMEFVGFTQIYKDLPDPKLILNGKDIVPKEANVTYALISALINEVIENPDKLNRLIEYSYLLEKEFSIILIKDLIKTELKTRLLSSEGFTKWAKENQEFIV